MTFLSRVQVHEWQLATKPTHFIHVTVRREWSGSRLMPRSSTVANPCSARRPQPGIWCPGDRIPGLPSRTAPLAGVICAKDPGTAFRRQCPPRLARPPLGAGRSDDLRAAKRLAVRRSSPKTAHSHAKTAPYPAPRNKCSTWRPHAIGYKVLNLRGKLERAKGFEPSTPTLASAAGLFLGVRRRSASQIESMG